MLVSVSNFGGLDLGLNLFHPPAIGSSLATQFWVNNGALIFAEPANDGEGNLYLEVAATGDVPEPSTVVMMLTAIPGFLFLRRRARTSL